jgi:hypothetical protein
MSVKSTRPLAPGGLTHLMTSLSGCSPVAVGCELGVGPADDAVGRAGVGDSVIGDWLADAVGSKPVSVGGGVALAPGVGVAGLAAHAANRITTANLTMRAACPTGCITPC